MSNISQSSDDFNRWLSEWRNDLLRGSSNDPLMHLNLDSQKFVLLDSDESIDIILALNPKIKKLIKEQQEFFKNAGIQSLCLVSEILIWKDEEKTWNSPLTLHNCTFSLDKIAKTLTVKTAELGFVNPFLEKIFAQKFDQNLSEWLQTANYPDGWELKKVRILGNFHYHRYVLLKDYDDYQQVEKVHESPLAYYLQEKSPGLIEPKANSGHYIFPMDFDQQSVFEAVVNGSNVLVEGPPGSGKSQVLTNLLFASAKNKKSAVLCSEKMTALQVVESKLEQKGLSVFCQILGVDASVFVRSLETSWNELEKRAAQATKPEHQIDLFTQKREALQFKLERLSSFPKLDSPLVRPSFELSYYSDWKDYVKYSNKLIQLNNNFQLNTGNILKSSSLYFFKTFVFADSLTVRQCIQQISHAKSLLTENQFSFLPIATWNELQKVQRTLLHAHILSQDLFIANPELFKENTKTFKKFHKDYQKYLELLNRIEVHNKTEGFKWKTSWSEQELFAAKNCFTNDRFWSTEYRQWKRKFTQNYSPEVFSRQLAVAAIDKCLEFNRLTVDYHQIIDDFRKLGIVSLEVDLPLVLQFQRQVNQNLVGLQQTQQEFNPEELAQLLKYESGLKEVHRFVNHHFNVYNEQNLFELFEQIEHEKEFLIGHQSIISELFEIEPRLREIIPQIRNYDELDEVMLWGTIKQFEQRNPALFHYRGEDLLRDAENLIVLENQHFDCEIQEFWSTKVNEFIGYLLLISNSSAKLTEHDKTLRKKLKSGRAILIKEFGKTRQHKTARELLESDAAPWIQLLKPILLINPLMMSKLLPNTNQLVDLMLFDEASQIPFSHAIPAIYRAKQIAIFGDSKQLSPSTFFLQGGSQRSDLLTESRHFLPILNLNYHYRSLHGSLISYSNRYFYENRLSILPAKNNPEVDGVFCHFTESIYHEGQNEMEAVALVRFLETLLKSASKQERIGIVAFSERQLSTLENYCITHASKRLKDGLENNEITLTTLEQVQGDEFDVLLISLGYGRDSENHFALRFGPINQEGGDKRLNVLFTRARRSLHFFHSVRARDFGATENSGVQALKNFLLMHESRTWNALHSGSKSENEQTFEIIDPFYREQALQHVMILLRHAELTGFKVQIKFWKDQVG